MILSKTIISPFASGVPPLVIPSEVSDGNTWLRVKYDDPVFRTVVGGIVTEWIDVMGSGRKLTNPTPANGGKLEADCVKFISAESRALRLQTALGAPTMLYLVIRPDSWVSTNRILDGGLSNAPFGMVTAEPQYYFGPSGYSIAGINIPTGSWSIVRALINGANSYVQVNNGSKITGDMGVTSLGGITLGARYTVAANWANVSYKEVMMRQIAETDVVADKFYTYLKALYGI